MGKMRMRPRDGQPLPQKATEQAPSTTRRSRDRERTGPSQGEQLVDLLLVWTSDHRTREPLEVIRVVAGQIGERPTGITSEFQDGAGLAP